MSKFSFEEKFIEVKEKVKNFIEKNKLLNEYLNLAQEKTKVEKEYLLVGGGTFLGDLIGFVFPLIYSIKAIESETLDDDKQWLTYWLVFSFFKMFESFADMFVSSIPFYFLIKCIFLLWCWHPQSLGAQLIHTSLIKVYLVPLLGFQEKAYVPTNTLKLQPQLEINIESVKLLDTTKELELFVEVCVHPPSTRKSTGVESTIFKTETRTGTEVIFNQPIILTPLTSTDGTISIRVMEKMTFGEDRFIAGKDDLEVKSFINNSNFITKDLLLNGVEVILNGKYTTEI